MARVIVTGGAGFIGSNVVARCLRRGDDVTVFDDLSRRGGRERLAELERDFGAGSYRVVVGDIADPDEVASVVDGADVVYHLAGQVAVTTSIADPRRDFASNAVGTLNVLEGARRSQSDPIVLYASTNKVYGARDGDDIVERSTRYEDLAFPDGVPESAPLDFHSPYGCSKGAGDMYVRDYARVFGLRTVVLRQSCIIGPGQRGIEDQGWLAWFLLAALSGRTVTVYGTGKQVRDILDVDDLLDAYDAAVENIDVASGSAFNVGGGPDRTLSIWNECGPLVERLAQRHVAVVREPARVGDQRVYVSDTAKARDELGWQPQRGLEESVDRLFRWMTGHRALLEHA